MKFVQKLEKLGSLRRKIGQFTTNILNILTQDRNLCTRFPVIMKQIADVSCLQYTAT